MVNRGEIWLVNLDPTVGGEIKKARPCVVGSPADMHDHLRTAIVAPMTTKGRPAPFRVPVTHGGRKGLNHAYPVACQTVTRADDPTSRNTTARRLVARRV